MCDGSGLAAIGGQGWNRSQLGREVGCLFVDRYKMVIGGIVLASGASKNLLRRPPLAGQLTVIKWL